MIHFLAPAGQDNIPEYLGLWGRDLAKRCRILDYESLPLQTRFDRGAYVLTSLDRLSPLQERLLGELHRRLIGNEGFRILNDPVRTLRRLDLLTELWRLKLNDFRGVRAIADLTHLRYPVFVRSERSHEGALSPLLHSPKEVAASIGRALLQGYRLGDLLVVEFCETADADGLYRRYAAFIVGRRIISRGLERGWNWIAKRYQSEFSRAMVLEERDYVFTNPHEAQLAGIFEIARVDYGRIDYSMKDGRVQTWEINLAPTIGRGLGPTNRQIPEELQPIRMETKRHFYARFREAWEAVDLAADGQPAVPFVLDPGAIRATRPPEPGRKRWFVSLAKVLRPAKPLLLALARPLLPLLGGLARLAAARQRGRSTPSGRAS